MRRFFPIILSLIIMVILAYVVISKKNKLNHTSESHVEQKGIGSFIRAESCGRPPQFLKKLNISQPVMIDLSQKRFKGIALLHGKNFEKAMHPKVWEQYEHFSTYTVDRQGNIYLVPMPFISIIATTFNLQKNIYKLDSKTGKISIFMHFDDVSPSGNNPYGINAITYDCEDNTLWVAAIDESNYKSQKGVIYHIDLKTKNILQRVEGFDVLAMTIVKSQKGKYLLVGSARDNGLYAFQIRHQELVLQPKKLLTLPSDNEYIRKIKVKGKNNLELQTIPFSYTLISQTSKKDRIYYHTRWDEKSGVWRLEKEK